MFTEVTDDEFRDNWMGLDESNQNVYDLNFDFSTSNDEAIIEIFEKNRFTFFTVKSNDFEQSKIKRGFLLRSKNNSSPSHTS